MVDPESHMQKQAGEYREGEILGHYANYAPTLVGKVMEL